MSGYTELRDLGVRFVAPDSPLPPSGNRYSPFSAPWMATVELLANELRHLGAEGISIELDMEPRMFRLDGTPRSDARSRSDAVRITFTSKWGPLRYETAEFSGRRSEQGWQANLRAIALAMEALRKVDRYGVSKRGEQYRGWRALPTGTDPANSIATPDQARAFLEQWSRDEDESFGTLVNRAVKATHPDAGGDETEFRKVIRARDLLSV